MRTLTNSASQLRTSSSPLAGLSSTFLAASTWNRQYSMTLARMRPDTLGKGMGLSPPCKQNRHGENVEQMSFGSGAMQQY